MNVDFHLSFPEVIIFGQAGVLLRDLHFKQASLRVSDVNGSEPLLCVSVVNLGAKLLSHC